MAQLIYVFSGVFRFVAVTQSGIRWNRCSILRGFALGRAVIVASSDRSRVLRVVGRLARIAAHAYVYSTHTHSRTHARTHRHEALANNCARVRTVIIVRGQTRKNR